MTKEKALAQPVQEPMFKVDVAKRKWESLQVEGHEMQHIAFAKGLNTGTIDAWGKVVWVKATPPLPVQEPYVRYCPDCGSIGPVPATARDCCPDGQHARMVPENFAKSCRETFMQAVLVEEMQRMAKRIEQLEALLESQTARIVDLQTHIDNFDGEDR
jgi:hypothetical protein